MTTKRVFPDDMDPACVPACVALCALPGVETTESCEGHGQEPPSIYFQVRSLAALHPIVRAIDRRYYAYTADRRHCVLNGSYCDDWWHLRVTETDLIDDRLQFYLTMRDVPDDAAWMLALLAQNVTDAARVLAEWEVAEGRGARLQISEIVEGAPRVSLAVAVPGVATRVVDAAPNRTSLDIANLGGALTYLVVDTSTSDRKLCLRPGEKIAFEPPLTISDEIFAITEIRYHTGASR
jgi:hypothetical protein